MKNIKEQYLKRKSTYERLLKKQTETINFISVLRLIVFASVICFATYFYIIKRYYLSVIILTILGMLFISLINKHSRLKYNKNCSRMICEINEDSLKRLKGEWKSFQDIGEEFINDNHNYLKDLDIVGKGSLFQYINVASTYLGREKLKEILSAPNYNIEEIYDRQKAVKELSDCLGWRQRFMAEGKIISKRKENPELLFKWAKEVSSLFCNKSFILMSRILPVITIGTILICLLVSGIPNYVPFIPIVIQIIILKSKAKECNRILSLIYKYKNDIEEYSKMISIIEKKKFKSKYLLKLQESLIEKGELSATQKINKLCSLTNLISDRANFFYHLINVVTLWEYHLLIRFEEWKKDSGKSIEKWFKVIADVEALSSLATLKHDHPEWIMPEIRDSALVFKSKNIGHPLLTKKPICNDLEMGKEKSILLITGSNMSGKSTLLRTTGINLVLAYAGGPVCAESLSCSIMNIYTCMRISDNLEENVSSFYAELLRIRQLMDATKRKEPVFFLLDEIFRGTNSKDRHTGARVLIEKLSKEKALGLISTHDLELSDIEQSNSKIKNYHFREFYENDQIKFDYKLRPGVSTTRNAIYLMKIAGIEIESDN